ncbi:MAG: ribosome-associated translation inhibitor RaiA [Clostridiaceae bacterium]|nr:ribosome-associated translation inhibitor RaiA [Clostridiaceae bacterium]
MKITIVARKFELTQQLKDYIEKKFGKLNKFFSDDSDARITLSVEKLDQKVEATIFSQNMIYRVEEKTTDMYSTIDKAVDSVERQIRKNKTRLVKRLREGSIANLTHGADNNVEEETEFNIVKTKRFETKPMSADEAILQMNLLGHEFFVFENDLSGKTTIVYKRKDRNYGLIEVK